MGCRSVRNDLPRWIALGTLALHLAVVLIMWWYYREQFDTSGGLWVQEFDAAWIPQLGIRLHFGIDGLSLLLIVLTDFLGIVSVAASWQEIRAHVGAFHGTLLLALAGLIGIFLALDLFLFYVCWELVLLPLYFMIIVWGHERRVRAAIKFFIFTQASSLLMLLGILGLYFVHGTRTGHYTFDYQQLVAAGATSTTAFWLMLGFLAAMAVKLPVVPLHTWLPDAHTEAPTAGSIVLAGLVLKAGAYGLLRFLIPLFPNEALHVATPMMVLGCVGILYGAVMAYGQTDLKRLVAYTSVSHLGFVLLGIFAWNTLALQGAVVVMLAHGISTGALFVLVGMLQHRLGTRELKQMGGLWETTPRLGGAGLVFAMASLGLPGLGNFVGEFLVLVGVYQVHPWIAAVAALGLVASAAYCLRLVQRVFFGPNEHQLQLPDSTLRETAILATMGVVILWLGMFPQSVLRLSKPAVDTAKQLAGERHTTAQAITSATKTVPLELQEFVAETSPPDMGVLP